MVDDGPRLDNVQEWLTMTEAAHLAGVSEKTMRRRVLAGQVESRIDENDGRGRYLIRASSVAPPAPGAQLVPMAVIEKLDALRVELTASEVARARAESLADFQAQRAALEIERANQERERRKAAEREVERLRSELDKANKELEADDSINAPAPRRWWQRPR